MFNRSVLEVFGGGIRGELLVIIISLRTIAEVLMF